MLEARYARGLPTPCIENRPVLFVWLEPIWQAFQDLCDGRDVSFGLRPVPAPDILAMIDLHGITDYDARLWWFRAIRALDVRWVELRQEKHGTTEGSSKSRAGS